MCVSAWIWPPKARAKSRSTSAARGKLLSPACNHLMVALPHLHPAQSTLRPRRGAVPFHPDCENRRLRASAARAKRVSRWPVAATKWPRRCVRSRAPIVARRNVGAALWGAVRSPKRREQDARTIAHGLCDHALSTDTPWRAPTPPTVGCPWVSGHDARATTWPARRRRYNAAAHSQEWLCHPRPLVGPPTLPRIVIGGCDDEHEQSGKSNEKGSSP
jgi:hypothetical protein